MKVSRKEERGKTKLALELQSNRTLQELSTDRAQRGYLGISLWRFSSMTILVQHTSALHSITIKLPSSFYRSVLQSAVDGKYCCKDWCIPIATADYFADSRSSFALAIVIARVFTDTLREKHISVKLGSGLRRRAVEDNFYGYCHRTALRW